MDFRPFPQRQVLEEINGKPAPDFWKEVDAGPKRP
jgi:hypothetical protein